MSRNYFFTIIFLVTIIPFFGQFGFQWAQQYGADDQDYAYAITLDSKKNVYSTGYFQWTADFDPGPGTYTLNGGNASVYVTKTDSSGNFIWAINFTSHTQAGMSIVVDNYENVYLTGTLAGLTDFDPGPGTYTATSNGSFDVFVCKLNNMGNLIWVKTFGGKNWDEGHSIDLDPSGNIYITGFFQDTVDFDPGPSSFPLISKGGCDIFVSKFDNNGNFIWAGKTGGTGDDRGNSIVCDRNGDVIYTGFYSDYYCDMNPGPAVSILPGHGNNTDIVISKLSSSGSLVWVKGIGGTAGDQGMCVKVDSLNNIYSTGSFCRSFDFDPGPGSCVLGSHGINDAYILKLTPQGNFAWAKTFGSRTWDYGTSLAVDPYGNSYICGVFSDTLDIDPGPGTYYLYAPNNYDEAFYTKLDLYGNFLCAGSFGGPQSDIPNSIALDNMNNIYLTGNFNDTTDLDPGLGTYSLISASNSFDIFISKIKPDCGAIITSLQEQISGALKVYPVPANKSLTISAPISDGTTIKGVLKNCFGQEVFSFIEPLNGPLLKTISIENLAKGIYFIEITDLRNVYQQKVIIE